MVRMEISYPRSMRRDSVAERILALHGLALRSEGRSHNAIPTGVTVDGFVGFHHTSSITTIAEGVHHAAGVGFVDETTHHHAERLQRLAVDDALLALNGAHGGVVFFHHHGTLHHGCGGLLHRSGLYGLRLRVLGNDGNRLSGLVHLLCSGPFVSLAIGALLRFARGGEQGYGAET